MGTLGATKVARDDNACSTVENPFQGGQKSPDSTVVSDVALTYGNVRVNAEEDNLTGEVRCGLECS
jgi:hypothetical protein